MRTLVDKESLPPSGRSCLLLVFVNIAFLEHSQTNCLHMLVFQLQQQSLVAKKTV